MKKKIMTISIICCLFIMLTSSFSFALDKDVDRNIISNNVSYITDYINQYGYVNGEGYKTIAYKPNGNISCWVILSNRLDFRLSLIEDDGTRDYVDMYVDLPYSERMPVEVNAFLMDANDNPIGGILSSGYVDPSDYVEGKNSIRFYIDQSSVSDSVAQEWSNWAFDYAIDCWDDMLENKMGVSIVTLGFSEICNHSWDKGVITKNPTTTANGVKKVTCTGCGKIIYQTIPKYKTTVTVDTATVSAKAIDAAIKKAGTKSNYVKKIIIGKKAKKISKNAFKKYKKLTTLEIKSKLIKNKDSVKGSLQGSAVKTVNVKVGSKEQNRIYVKKYKVFFTKNNAGKKVTIK